MLIGFTYDLRHDYLKAGYSDEETAEFDRLETIEGVVSTLESLGYTVIRIGNIYSLCSRLSRGERWDLVFNICEGLYGAGRESQIPCMLDAFKIPYTFSDPVVLGICLHKGVTKKIIKSAGIPTADFGTARNMKDVYGIGDIEYPAFVKPIAEGTSKGVTSKSKVNSKKEMEEVCRELLVKYKQEVLVEEYLPGREVTVGILGTGESSKVIGVMEIILKENAEREGYTYKNKENWKEMMEYKLINDELAKYAAEISNRAWRVLGCRDAGRVDLRCDKDGVLKFIEVNPLPGISPNYSDLPILCEFAGIKYKELIQAIVKSAIKREYDKWKK